MYEKLVFKLFPLRPKKKKSVFGVTWPRKRGSVGRLFFFFLVGPLTSLMYFEKGGDANISCLRVGAGDLLLFFSSNGLILEDWQKKALLY